MWVRSLLAVCLLGWVQSPVRAAVYASVADIPADMRAELEKFGGEFEADLLAGEFGKVYSRFNAAATAELVCEGMTTEPSVLAGFKSGLAEGLATNFENISRLWLERRAKFKGVVLYDKRPAVRFRFLQGGGVSFVDLALRKGGDGRLCIVDLYNHAAAAGQVEQTRQAAIPLIGSLDQNAFSRWFRLAPLTEAEVEQTRIYFESAGKQDRAYLVSEYPKLPASVRAIEW